MPITINDCVKCGEPPTLFADDAAWTIWCECNSEFDTYWGVEEWNRKNLQEARDADNDK